MGNRIIKESICTSDSVDELSWFEEVLFYRLIVNCDDFGRFDGRTAVIKNRLFPLKDNVTTKAVDAALQRLASVELVVLYEFEGKPYLYLPTWNEHQSIRAKRSKYPAPKDNVKSSASKCMQMQADACKCSRNPIQSNPNPIQSESISESESNRGDGDFSLSLSEAVPEKSETVEKIESDIARYFGEYFGRVPTRYEIERITLLVKSLRYAAGGGSQELKYDFDESELLRIAFESAADKAQPNVAYIEGVFGNYQTRRIYTLDDYYDDDMKRQGPL